MPKPRASESPRQHGAKSAAKRNVSQPTASAAAAAAAVAPAPPKANKFYDGPTQTSTKGGVKVVPKQGVHDHNQKVLEVTIPQPKVKKTKKRRNTSIVALVTLLPLILLASLFSTVLCPPPAVEPNSFSKYALRSFGLGKKSDDGSSTLHQTLCYPSNYYYQHVLEPYVYPAIADVQAKLQAHPVYKGHIEPNYVIAKGHATRVWNGPVKPVVDRVSRGANKLYGQHVGPHVPYVKAKFIEATAPLRLHANNQYNTHLAHHVKAGKAHGCAALKNLKGHYQTAFNHPYTKQASKHAYNAYDYGRVYSNKAYTFSRPHAEFAYKQGHHHFRNTIIPRTLQGIRTLIDVIASAYRITRAHLEHFYYEHLAEHVGPHLEKAHVAVAPYTKVVNEKVYSPYVAPVVAAVAPQLFLGPRTVWQLIYDNVPAAGYIPESRDSKLTDKQLKAKAMKDAQKQREQAQQAAVDAKKSAESAAYQATADVKRNVQTAASVAESYATDATKGAKASISSVEKQARAATDNVKDNVNAAAKSAESYASQAQKQAKASVSSAEKQARAATDNVKENIQTAASVAGSYASEATKHAKASVSSVDNAARSAAGKVQDDVNSAASVAESYAADATKQAKASVASAGEQARAATDNVKANASSASVNAKASASSASKQAAASISSASKAAEKAASTASQNLKASAASVQEQVENATANVKKNAASASAQAEASASSASLKAKASASSASIKAKVSSASAQRDVEGATVKVKDGASSATQQAKASVSSAGNAVKAATDKVKQGAAYVAGEAQASVASAGNAVKQGTESVKENANAATQAAKDQAAAKSASLAASSASVKASEESIRSQASASAQSAASSIKSSKSESEQAAKATAGEPVVQKVLGNEKPIENAKIHQHIATLKKKVDYAGKDAYGKAQNELVRAYEKFIREDVPTRRAIGEQSLEREITRMFGGLDKLYTNSKTLTPEQVAESVRMSDEKVQKVLQTVRYGVASQQEAIGDPAKPAIEDAKRELDRLETEVDALGAQIAATKGVSGKDQAAYKALKKELDGWQAKLSPSGEPSKKLREVQQKARTAIAEVQNEFQEMFLGWREQRDTIRKVALDRIAARETVAKEKANTAKIHRK